MVYCNYLIPRTMFSCLFWWKCIDYIVKKLIRFKCDNHVCEDWVELDKTQVAAEATVGQGSVKALREMQIYKKLKNLHQYVCFC